MNSHSITDCSIDFTKILFGSNNESKQCRASEYSKLLKESGKCTARNDIIQELSFKKYTTVRKYRWQA